MRLATRREIAVALSGRGGICPGAKDHRLTALHVAIHAVGDDRVEIRGLWRRGRVVARKVQELTDDAVHFLDVGDHARAGGFVGRLQFDAQPQPRQRRTQVVGDASQQQRPIAFDLAQVAEHGVEAPIDRGDFRRSGFGQRRRRFAAAHAADCARQFPQRTGEKTREHVRCGEQQGQYDERPGQRSRRDIRSFRPLGHRKPDPVALPARDDAHEQQTQAWSHANFGIRTQVRAQSLLEIGEQRTQNRLADVGALGFRNDAHVVFAIQALQRFPSVRAVGTLQRGAERLQLCQLGVAELPDEELGAIVPEHDDAGEHRQGHHGNEQQNKAPEQRARDERHGVSSPSRPASGCPLPSGSATSGT